MLKTIFTKEPALAAELIKALIVLVTAFGLQLSGEQIAAIMLVVGAVSGIVTRAQVTPNQKVIVHEDDAEYQAVVSNQGGSIVFGNDS